MSGLNFENISTVLNYEDLLTKIVVENVSTVLNFDLYEHSTEWAMFKALLDFLGFSEGAINDIFMG